ncbi:MAG: nicotinamide-nucleotide amidohydrolase family protein [Acidobacteria bacterium]|nr:nicotinamide-nucleotide amidohydrolase family protein [Acidobacteriota bacterium]
MPPQPKAVLLIVGSEMTDPGRPDANGPLAREALAGLGIPLAAIVRVEDDVASIAHAFGAALASADVVIASGGLGPTGDDLTREGAALALGREVVTDPGWLAELERRLAARARPLNDAGRRQALVVGGGEAIPNSTGLACGSWIEHGGRVVALLPGIPSEFAAMLRGWVVPRVAARFPRARPMRLVRAVAAGLPEASAEPVLAPWYRRPGVAVSILPSSGVLWITFTLRGDDDGALAALESEAREALAQGLGAHLVSLDGTSLEEALGERLLRRGWTVAVAEACGAGLAAHRVVSVPGASRWFAGALAPYSNAAKTALLGVPPELIERHGAASAEVARAMAAGVRERFGASCGVATSGIAGPGGATPDKPVGTVHIAAVTPEREQARRLDYPVDRLGVLTLSANYALYQLWRLLGE